MSNQLTIAESSALEQRPASMLETVMRAVADPSIDPDRLERFLRIGRELEADQARRQWAIAFRAAKDELDGVRLAKNGRIVYEGKNGKAGNTIKFLEYDDIAEAVKPILRKNDLTASYTYRYESAPPKTICVMTLLHAGGHSQTFESVPLPMIDSSGGKTDVQGAGSVMTYGRRYATQAAFDIVATGQDNDGSGKGLPDPVTEDQAMKLEDVIEACNSSDSKFRAAFTKWLKTEFNVDGVRSLFQGDQLEAVQGKLKEKMLVLNVK